MNFVHLDPYVSGDATMIWTRILSPEIIWVFIPLVAILCGSIISLVKRGHRHRERMAMIAAGMHPDFPPDEDPEALEGPHAGQSADYEHV